MSMQPYPYLTGVPLVTNITPFTYRSGATYLEILETLSSYIRDVLTPNLDKINADILAEVEARVMEISNRVGPESFQRVDLSGPYTVEIGVAWPDKHPIHFQVKQNIVGSHPVLLGAGITGTIQVDPLPGAVTEFTLVPRGKGEWYVSQTPMTRAAFDAAVAALLTPVLTAVRNDMATLDKAVRDDLGAVTRIYTTAPIDVVFIGDSYFNGFQDGVAARVKAVPTRVVELLNGQGLNTYRERNYADAAQGYTVGSATLNYRAQVDRALADPAITNCRLIVFGGGRNDAGNDAYAAAKELYAKVKAKWPAAQLVVAPMWSREKFTNGERRTFQGIYQAAKECGAIYSINSLWVNAITPAEQWAGAGVLHPRDELSQRFANAIYTLIQGGELPGHSTDLAMRGTTGINAGIGTIEGWNITLSFQHFVGAEFTANYPVGSLGVPVLHPGTINQYMVGFTGNGAQLQLWTVNSADGSLFITGNGTAPAGLCGLSGSYPVGV